MKAALDQLVRSASAPRCRRGRIVLVTPPDKTNPHIACELQLPEVTVSKSRHCFVRQGLEGLLDAPRSGRPAQHGPESVRRVPSKPANSRRPARNT